MAATFSRTLQLLETERFGRKGALTLFAALLAAWAAWFVWARVPVYESSPRARIEVTAAAHPVAARVGGQVIRTNLRIGDHVQAEDILVELDAEADRLTLAEKQASHAGRQDRLAALQREIAAEKRTLELQAEASTVAFAEARAQIKEAEAKAEFADRQAQTYARLRTTNAAADLDYRQAIAQAAASRAVVQTLTVGVDRLQKDRAVLEGDRRVRLAKLEREAVELQSDLRTDEVMIRRLKLDIEFRTIRAPISGRIGETGDVRLGSVVRVGEKLAAIVPEGMPQAIAFFPAAIVGKVQPGQAARLRLEGFAWTEFGTLPATVRDVANESIDGMVRVELDISPSVQTPIPLEHGQPGSAEVEVDRVSPAILVLRSAGQLLAHHPSHLSKLSHE